MAGTTPADSDPPLVTVRYWAAAKEAAGCGTEKLPGRTLAEVIRTAGDLHGPDLSRLLEICSFIVGDQPAKRAAAEAIDLDAGVVVEVLPPFAGGSGLHRPAA